MQLGQKHRQLHNKCVRTVRNAKLCYFVNTLSDCNSNPAKFWKTRHLIMVVLSPFPIICLYILWLCQKKNRSVKFSTVILYLQATSLKIQLYLQLPQVMISNLVLATHISKIILLVEHKQVTSLELPQGCPRAQFLVLFCSLCI